MPTLACDPPDLPLRYSVDPPLTLTGVEHSHRFLRHTTNKKQAQKKTRKDSVSHPTILLRSTAIPGSRSQRWRTLIRSGKSWYHGSRSKKTKLHLDQSTTSSSGSLRRYYYHYALPTELLRLSSAPSASGRSSCVSPDFSASDGILSIPPSLAVDYMYLACIPHTTKVLIRATRTATSIPSIHTDTNTHIFSSAMRELILFPPPQPRSSRMTV